MKGGGGEREESIDIARDSSWSEDQREWTGIEYWRI